MRARAHTAGKRAEPAPVKVPVLPKPPVTLTLSEASRAAHLEKVRQAEYPSDEPELTPKSWVVISACVLAIGALVLSVRTGWTWWQGLCLLAVYLGVVFIIYTVLNTRKQAI